MMRMQFIATSVFALGVGLIGIADLGAQGAQPRQAQAPPTLDQLKAMPTPRGADGKPTLTGWWGGGRGGGFGGGGGASNDAQGFVTMAARDGRLQNLENDSYISQKSEDPPLYKPECWSKGRELELHGNLLDRAM